MLWMRIPMLLISYKKSNICRAYLWYQIVLDLVQYGMPRDFGQVWYEYFSFLSAVNFAGLYFDLKPALFGSTVFQVFAIATRYFLYLDPYEPSKIGSQIVSIPLNILNLLIYHYIISWVGYIYAKSEISRAGNESLLNNLNEGVVIVAKSVKQISFANRAAVNLQKTLT